MNHLDAYAALRERIGSTGAPRDIVIMGAGLVGCELADDLASLGHRCTVLEAAAQPLAGLAPPDVAATLVSAFAAAQITIRTGTRVTSVRRDGARYRVDCAAADQALDGQTPGAGASINADMVLAATGLRTSDRIALAAGLQFQQGYAVDALTMLTSDEHVYALGDCASFDGKTYRFIEPIQRQAKVIAAHIAGAPSAGFVVRAVPVRLKSRTMPLTFQMAA